MLLTTAPRHGRSSFTGALASAVEQSNAVVLGRHPAVLGQDLASYCTAAGPRDLVAEGEKDRPLRNCRSAQAPI
jgi:hypothetical protein